MQPPMIWTALLLSVVTGPVALAASRPAADPTLTALLAEVQRLSVAGGQWLVSTEDGRIDGAVGRKGGAGLVYWLVGAISLPGVTGWDRAHTPGLLRELFTDRSRSSKSTAPGR